MILKLRDRYGRFLTLLVAIVAYLVLFPLLQESSNDLIAAALTLMIPIAGVYAVSAERRTLVIASILAIPVVLELVTPNEWPPLFTYGSLVALYGFVLLRVLREVLSSVEVSLDTLFGAAAAYLLMGLAWASMFMYLERSRPVSFVINAANDVGPAGLQWFEMIHYSYVTLTTLGYGEITPVSSIARSLSFLEAATGVLYLAFLVARLVSAHMSAPTERPPDG
jgi:hypothetical protein